MICSKTVVTVQFDNSSKNYAFFANRGVLVDGDYVVVRTGSLKIARVVQTKGLTRSQREKATKWIVQKIDTTAYLANMEREKLSQEIKNRLRDRKEEMEEMMIYATLAKGDPEIAAMLAQLQMLENGSTVETAAIPVDTFAEWPGTETETTPYQAASPANRGDGSYQCGFLDDEDDAGGYNAGGL